MEGTRTPGLLIRSACQIYAADRRMAMLYTLFAFIAIVVSCLGLFGISLFDIRQRYREIAICKVNGAMLKDLYVL